jgi:hypothetical protein
MADGGSSKRAPAKKAPAKAASPTAPPSGPSTPAPATPKAPRWRRIVGATLLVIGCLLVPLSVSAVWVRNTLLDTDNYVETVSPLAENSDVQEALSINITKALFSQVDVQQKVQDALGEVGPRAEILASPIASGLQSLTEKVTLKALQTDQFQTLWEQANRRVHTRLEQVLTGGGPNVSTENGDVVINVGHIFDAVKAKLDDRGISLFDNVSLPKKDREFTLVQSDVLNSAQTGVDILQTLAWVLPFALLLCLAGAIVLSTNRRRTVFRAAIGVALAIGVQLVLLGLGRNLYLDAIRGPGRPGHAAGAIWDQLTEFLRLAGQTIFVLAIIVAIAAWVLGPSKAATNLRAWCTRVFGGEGSESAGFVGRHKMALRGTGIGLAIIVLIAWNHPTPLLVLIVAVLLLVWLAVVEFLGRGTSVDETADI